MIDEARFAEIEGRVQAFLPEPGRFERLRREEEALHARWPDPGGRPPLFGVTVGAKDIFRVDGFETRAGSRLPPELFAGPEASSVTALRNAGALMLGKTVSTEFAFYAPGATRNPRNLEHTPGGSSSGSAAAVSAGLCPLALGTQTIGSLIRPAAFCGIVAFKPTYGRIATDGVVPLAPSLDHVGVFTPDAALARTAASLLCRDWRPGLPERHPRLGVPVGPYLDRASPEAREHFEAVAARLAAAGYEIAHVPAFEDFDEIERRHHRTVAAEAARVHAEWFPRYESLYEARTADLIRRGQAVSDAQLEDDLAGRECLRDALTRLMDDEGLDLWISPPTLGPAPRGLSATGDPVMNLPWTQALMPALGLPAGENAAGLPLGLQVTARWGADEELLGFGLGLEGAVKA